MSKATMIRLSIRMRKYWLLNSITSTKVTPRASSTASVSESILEYRRIQGRTYHSDKFRNGYVFPNDDRQLESVDLRCLIIIELTRLR